jgi:hypothetical protein
MIYYNSGALPPPAGGTFYPIRTEKEPWRGLRGEFRAPVRVPVRVPIRAPIRVPVKCFDL